jgi:hypothetical protein
MGLERTLLSRTVADKRKMFYILGGRILPSCHQFCHDINCVHAIIDAVVLDTFISGTQIDQVY